MSSRHKILLTSPSRFFRLLVKCVVERICLNGLVRSISDLPAANFAFALTQRAREKALYLVLLQYAPSNDGVDDSEYACHLCSLFSAPTPLFAYPLTVRI